MKAPRTLFARGPGPEADVRPTLLGIVTLMFLLLFFLLTTSSGERLGVVDLRLAAAGELATLPHTGLVSDVRVTLRGTDATLEFAVQTTDISASSTAVEQRRVDVPAREGRVDLAALSAAVEQVHAIDPAQTRVTLLPDDAVPVDTLFGVLDVVRGPPGAPLYPRITLR
ncbi:MAG: hypothetical protein ACOZNI_23895 [Myxococcota bacterium]